MQELIAKSARQFELGCKELINNDINFEIKVVVTPKPKLEYHFIVDLPEQEFALLEEKFKLNLS